MVFTVRVYLNTGFNSVNVPDSPALLNSMSYIDLPSLDVNQERFLSSIRVRTTWTLIENADYCKVGDFFYYIASMRMTSGDVCELALIPDYALSAGGWASLTILDGLTDRVHVTDDTYGKYTGDDPLMAPAYDLDVASFTKKFSGTKTTCVETTLDLQALGAQKRDNTTLALTAKDSTDPTNPFTVTYPVVPTIADQGVDGTEYGAIMPDGVEASLSKVKNQGVYRYGVSSDNLTGMGISQARSLGVEEAISGQYAIPDDFVDFSSSVSAYQTKLKGKTGSVSTGLNFIYGTANNKRVFYGNLTPYTLVSAIGNSFTANGEEVYNGSTSPSIRYIADPRRSGKPYFRFETLNGINCTSNAGDFFRGAVAGKEWNNVPLVLTEKSGSVLDFLQHRNSMAENWMAKRQSDVAFDLAMGKTAAGAVGQVGQATAGAIMGFGAGTQAGQLQAVNSISGGVGGLAGVGFSYGEANMNYNFAQQRMAMERAKEAQQFAISQSVNVPDIRFPIDCDLFAEATGNGFMVYRTKYKAADITRIDKILTAFGYKHTKILEASDFSNRTYFNYVSGSISVGGAIPAWWADGISAQMAAGVRVWHVKPDPQYYASNPVAQVTP